MLAAERLVDWGPLPASVAQAFEVALEALERDLGLAVERIGPADVFTAGNIDDDWFVMATVEQAYELGRETIEREKAKFTDVFAYCMEQGLAYTAEEYATLRRRRFAYIKELDELLGADVVLATPTLCVEEQSAEGRVPGHEGIGTPAWVFNTQAQNLTGPPRHHAAGGGPPHRSAVWPGTHRTPLSGRPAARRRSCVGAGKTLAAGRPRVRGVLGGVGVRRRAGVRPTAPPARRPSDRRQRAWIARRDLDSLLGHDHRVDDADALVHVEVPELDLPVGHETGVEHTRLEALLVVEVDVADPVGRH